VTTDPDATAGAAGPEPRWQALVRLGLAVRWTTLAEGLRASRRRQRPLVTVGDVGAWACALVEAAPEQPLAVYELLAIAPGTGNDPDSLADVQPVLRALAAGERADRAAELAKFRLAELAALVERVATWPVDPDEDFDTRACDMWSTCRDVWESWIELLGRDPFFYPDGREVRCYDGRRFDDVIAEYRGWIAGERARLRDLDRAADGGG
jgi:hypothetical protein